MEYSLRAANKQMEGYMDAERQRLINEAARIVNEIDQQIIDIEYWNECHPDEEPIVADPKGEMVMWREGLQKMLDDEAGRGNVPSVVPIKAHRRRYVPLYPSPADLPVAE